MSGPLDNTSIPHWTAAEVVALLDRPTKIDNSTGSGNNNFRSTSSGGGILYPDGIFRSSVTGYYRHESRHYWASEDNETLLAYWNDYLGLSADIEDALDNYTKIRRVHKLIKEYQDHLELSDAELDSKFSSSGEEIAQKIRERFKKYIDIWVGERDNTKITFAGYPLIYPDNGTKKLKTSTLIKDVGYWDFSETGVNSVEGGYDWSFSSSVKDVDA